MAAVVTFLGATVYDYSTQIGWNEQQTTLTVKLVEDPTNGDNFLLKDTEVPNFFGQMVGSPVSFQHDNFRFDGLILAWNESESVQGLPVYSVTLQSPTEILRGTKVILSNYVGPVNDSRFNSSILTQAPTFQCSNLLNVYGYLEQGGTSFGTSQINDMGLLWTGTHGVKHSLETLTNTTPRASSVSPTTNYGSYITFRGNYYSLDLSGLPVPPDFYRIGGNVYMSALDLISQVAQDGGVDYLANLTINPSGNNGPHTISFKTVNRVQQTTLGQLSRFLTGQTDVEQVNAGQEFRNDTTQAFIIGGDITVLEQVYNSTDSTLQTVFPFWGFDVDGNPILGQTANGTLFADDDYAMNLNSSPVADITGALGFGVTYPCSIAEMRCALIDYDSWAAFMFSYKPLIADQLGIIGSAYVTQNTDNQPFLVTDFIDDRLASAVKMGQMNQNEDWITVSQRLYEFVRNQTDTYYGKQFLIQVPDSLQLKVIPNSTQIVYSDEPADAGYQVEGEIPLGLSFTNENFFLDQTGRFYPFIRFAAQSTFNSVYALANGTSNVVTANFSSLNGGGHVIQLDSVPGNSYIYTRYEVGAGPVIQNGILGGGSPYVFVQKGNGGVVVPCIIATVSNAVFAQATDPLGSINDISTILNTLPEVILNAANFRLDSFPMKIHPPAFYPNAATIALKSNQYTYGPWGKFVTDGQTDVQYDPSLTPWDFGSYQSMNQAAAAKLINLPTGNQVLERGDFTKPESPQFNLADYLIVNGPVVSRIDAQIGIQGQKTTYTFETFVPRLGVFTRQNVDLIKQYGQNLQEMRRHVRQLFLSTGQTATIKSEAYRGFMYGANYAVRQATPHGTLVGHLLSVSGVCSPVVYTNTYRESVSSVHAEDDEKYQTTACGGWESLIRPVSTSFNPFGNISHFSSGDAGIMNDVLPTIGSSEINPVSEENDFIWLTTGETYTGLNTRKNVLFQDLTNVRTFALRGPLMLTGWGYDIGGNPVPNSNASGVDLLQDYRSTFTAGYPVNSASWMTGPVDLKWDKFRGVWTIPTVIAGTYASGRLYINPSGATVRDYITFEKFFDSNPADHTKCVIAYFPLENKWHEIALNCSAG